MGEGWQVFQSGESGIDESNREIECVNKQRTGAVSHEVVMRVRELKRKCKSTIASLVDFEKATVIPHLHRVV